MGNIGQPLSNASRAIANQNALRKAGNDANLAKKATFLATILRIEKKPVRGTTIDAELTKEKNEKARGMLGAFRNAKEKHGRLEAVERTFAAEMLRQGRETDAGREWGVSFRAGLKELNRFYMPVNLENTVKNYLARIGKRAVIVEVGAGAGNAAAGLNKVFGTKVKIIATGIRFLPEWKNLPGSRQIDWRVAHAENLSALARAGTVDIVHSNLGIGHSANKEKAIDEARKLLKKGGLLLFTVEKDDILPKNRHPNFELLKKSQKTVKSDQGPEKLFTYLLRKK